MNDAKASFMDDIRVASPCRASWDDMTGDERSRACAHCRKNVYNLSGMTRAEIETLIREKEGRLCVRFYRRADGRLVTADCPPFGEHGRHWRFAALAAAASLAVGLATAMPANSTKPNNAFSKLVASSIQRLKSMLGMTPPPPAPPPGLVAMGEMCWPPATPPSLQPPTTSPQVSTPITPSEAPPPPTDGGIYRSGETGANDTSE